MRQVFARPLLAARSVPSPAEEDAKRPYREREHLVQEHTRYENRILALLATQASGEGRPCVHGNATLRRCGQRTALPKLLS